nr:hypothetical protein [Pseudoclavibacter sp. Marseille-Q3772]
MTSAGAIDGGAGEQGSVEDALFGFEQARKMGTGLPGRQLVVHFTAHERRRCGFVAEVPLR